MESDLRSEEDAMREQCRTSLRKLSIGSAIFQDDDSILDSCANRLGNEEVEVGNVLGKGSFSSVRELRGIRNTDTSTLSGLSESTEAPGGSARSERGYYYAVKSLREDLNKNLHKNGAIDLAIEAQFLTSLSHKNIVSLQAHGDDPGAKDFFIIIERVERTLAEAIRSWKFQRIINASRSGQRRERKKNLFLSQTKNYILPYALDIVSALKYLHGKNIIFRDLKSENIGIDFENNLKLFDFGLATELRQAHYVAPNKYKYSIAGTRRYMSPEVATGKPYGLPADVYSFAILLNEMISQEKPFEGMSAENHTRAIVLFRRRPSIPKSCPHKIRKIIQSSWNHKPHNRPDMVEIQEIISSFLSKE